MQGLLKPVAGLRCRHPLARIAAIGPGTEAKLREYGLALDIMPKKFVAEGLVKAFKDAREMCIRDSLCTTLLAALSSCRQGDENPAAGSPGEIVPEVAVLTVHGLSLIHISLGSSRALWTITAVFRPTT